MSRPCALYRHYDDQGVLLYVGISARVGTRTEDHAYGSAWVEYASHGSIEWLPTLEAGIAAEKNAIRSERPVFNKAYAPRGQQQRIDEYLQRRGVAVEPRFIADSADGLVTLREACEKGITKHLTLDGLRKAAQRADFPAPRFRSSGGTYLYDPSELDVWYQLRAKVEA